MSRYTAAEVAEFDQALSVASHGLDVHVGALRATADRLGRMEALHGANGVIMDDLDSTEVRSLLLAALWRLAFPDGADDPSSLLDGESRG